MINIMVYAYLGDSIYELYIRDYLIDKGISNINDLQKESVNYVSAKSQARLLANIIDDNILLEEELDIVKRARNYKRSTHPKNTDIVTYKHSSAFEALIGYLYKEGKTERLQSIMKYILEKGDK